MAAEFYLLDPGKYKLTVTTKDSDKEKLSQTHEFAVKGRRTRVSFDLPPHRLCALRIQPVNP
jgi:hypothetical protein